MSRQWDAKFNGRFCDDVNKRIHEPSKKRITVFADDRDEAVREVVKAANLYGYIDVTIDHITRIG